VEEEEEGEYGGNGPSALSSPVLPLACLPLPLLAPLLLGRRDLRLWSLCFFLVAFGGKTKYETRYRRPTAPAVVVV